ncbi:hypothetical protein [Bradyrhizobium sp. CCBAU 53338]|uniref:hypothetical protein n=1 Tax=Bradyrhizobium sp. CCBAU 53338 TaxID=1325111 RepID=UPI00188B9985|nr:hypothetical protein [Bradyrhizobium sp. CCBAU 53338]QOZ51672.1 hypothetical protein XH90_09950 [Bradyrhizobium sp. CCBAU 53338]
MIRNEANDRRRREADEAFKTIGNVKPMTDYAKAEQSFHDNRKRLKAERLAREAAARKPLRNNSA